MPIDEMTVSEDRDRVTSLSEILFGDGMDIAPKEFDSAVQHPYFSGELDNLDLNMLMNSMPKY